MNPDDEELETLVKAAPFWLANGQVAEGRKLLSEGLARCTRASPGPKAKAMKAAGALAYCQSDYEETLFYSNAALSLMDAIGEEFERKQIQAQALNNKAVVADDRGEYEQAIELYESSLVVLKELKDFLRAGMALNNMGRVAAHQGNYEAAEAFFNEALALHEAEEDFRGKSNYLLNLGELKRLQGDYAAARRLLAQGEAIAREVGDPYLIGNALDNQGDVEVCVGDYGRARALLTEALEVRRGMDEKLGIAAALTSLGIVHRKMGQYVSAREHLTNGLQIRRGLGVKRDIIYSLEELAALEVDEKHFYEAIRLLRAAEQLRIAIALPMLSEGKLEYEVLLQTIRETLGEDAVASAWKEPQEN